MDGLTRAMLSSVLFVAQQLLSHKAAWLPWACNVFLQQGVYTSCLVQVALVSLSMFSAAMVAFYSSVRLVSIQSDLISLPLMDQIIVLVYCSM